MLVIVKFWADMPSNSDGIPGEWPAEVNPYSEGDPVPENFVVMTVEELEAYKASVQHLYDAWEAEQLRLQQLRQQAEEEKLAVIQRVDLGRSIIANLAAEMVLLELTEEQKADIIISIQDVILMLLAGQIEKAKQIILDLQPNVKIDQVLVDHLKAFIIKEVE